MILIYNNEKILITEIENKTPFSSFSFHESKSSYEFDIGLCDDTGLWGFGERFDLLNQKGLKRENLVYEKFTNQGDSTYLPVPLVLSKEVGIFVDTDSVIEFSSFENDQGLHLVINFNESVRNIYFFEGNFEFQIKEFMNIVGVPDLPPKWSFGPWMSANRWNSQSLVLEEAKKAKELDLFHSVLVVEAWSDEATFYNFNDQKLWPNPKEMIDSLHAQNLKLILWQIPIFKKLDEGQTSDIHDRDCKYAIDNKLVVLKDDGSPYTIPEGRWFGESMLPDFTNPKTKDWWFKKRQYLLDIGVDGFKTDGGEFIYDDEVKFSDGSTGLSMKNKYSYLYTKSYKEFIGEDRVLFSRAGYTGGWANTLFWGGDQLSTWEELKHVLIAGLNASMSGVFYWGFDIAGFAGPMPSKELYLRSFSLATFVPIMQWHSEPIGGQFAELLESKDSVNDRSPWNIAKHYNDDSVVDVCRKYCNLRKDLMSYIFEEAKFSRENGFPLMTPLFVKYSCDDKTYDVDDEFLFGRNLLIAPILNEGEMQRDIYLPEGNWFDYQLQKTVVGGRYINRNYKIDEIGIFVNLALDNELIRDIFNK